MSTVTKLKPTKRAATKEVEVRSKQQLRRDRIVAIVALAVVVAMMAIMMWLASLSNAPTNIDYFPMMP